jgi:hypothetical protein
VPPIAWANGLMLDAGAERCWDRRELGMHWSMMSYNIAKREWHLIDGTRREVCVHREGNAPLRQAIQPYRRLPRISQPVLFLETGRYSYVLVGTEQAMAETFSAFYRAGQYRVARRLRRVKEGLWKIRGPGLCMAQAGHSGGRGARAYKDVVICEVVLKREFQISGSSSLGRSER